MKARRAIDLVWLDPQRARPLQAVPTTPLIAVSQVSSGAGLQPCPAFSSRVLPPFTSRVTGARVTKGVRGATDSAVPWLKNPC